MMEWLVQVSLIPVWLWYLCVFGLGAIIGSFLNVYIYRFHTGKSLNGRSHCMSCGTSLCWFELFPLFSYLGLRGRCRTCSCRITPRYFLVELSTAGLFVLAAYAAVDLLMFVWLTSVLIILLLITIYDYFHFIIPDEFSIALTALTASWLAYLVWAGQLTTSSALTTVVVSVAGAAFFFFLWAISGGRWLGFGDVKLAVPLGLWVGASLVFSYIVLSFWVGALISLVIVGWQRYVRGKHLLHNPPETLTMKSAVPFAPFMVAGAVLVYFLHIDVLTLFSFW